MFLWSEFRGAAKKVIFITLLLSVFLFAIGCDKEGNVAITDKGESSGNQTASFPLTITDSANRSVTFEESPKRIITVLPSDMEIIYALGGKVVGRPKNSTGELHPPEAIEAEVVGHPRLINFEEVAALKGDMFVGHKRVNQEDVSTLEALNLKVILTQGDSIDEIKDLIEMYGNILGQKKRADALVQTIEGEVAKIREENRKRDVKALILVGTLDETMVALPHSLAGNIFETVGVKNIYENMPGLKTAPTYAQLSLERILEADPDVIYFMSMSDDKKTLELFQTKVASNPVWGQLTAMRNDRFIILPRELFGLSPGPRIVESLQFLGDSLDGLGY